MRRLLMAALLAVSMVAMGAGAAFAGEVTGTNQKTPVKDPGVSKSFCAFSGLEDHDGNGGVAIPGDTQNWGQIVKAAGGGIGGAADTVGPEGPTGCNANLYPAK